MTLKVLHVHSLSMASLCSGLIDSSALSTGSELFGSGTVSVNGQ